MTTVKDKNTIWGLLKRLLFISKKYWYLMLLLLAVSAISSLIEVGYMESIRRIVQGATDLHVHLVYGGVVLGIVIIILRFAFTSITTWLHSTSSKAHPTE